jgi:ribosomal protein L3 glutamine methyltransferase
LKTIIECVKWACAELESSDVFLGHGIDNYWDEALTLVTHVLELPFDIDESYANHEVNSKQVAIIKELLKKRIDKKIPVAYLVHEAWFCGFGFYIDERVIIPRSPIAELIEAHFSPWIKADKVRAILDLCTGSGCIAIACAKTFPGALVDAVDYSKEALAVAETNVTELQADNVDLIYSDMFAALDGKQYDIIVSNPPYVSDEEMAGLPSEYGEEPDMSLRATDNGLAFAKIILQQAYTHLAPNGILIVEVGNSADALIAAFPSLPFVWLEFARGGDGVFLLEKKDLKDM